MRFGIGAQRAARTLATFDTGFVLSQAELVPSEEMRYRWSTAAQEPVCGGDVLGLQAAPRSSFSRKPRKMNNTLDYVPITRTTSP